MEELGESENSRERQPWTLEMMLENREKWNLAADVGVLEYMRKFGNDLLNETENTLKLLDSFESELNTSCVQVSNITNKFLALADTQFVENRVCDEEEQTSAPVSVTNTNKTKVEEEKEALDRLKEAINNGLNVLKTKFEVVEVVNSDSEDDDNSPTGLVYKPINPFDNRPLPHLIGSVEFMKDPTVGLEEPPSDDDDDDSVDGSSSSESKAISEENEDSEPESDRPNLLPESSNYRHDQLTDILYKQPISSSFADHLAKRLEDMDNDRKVVHPPEKSTRNLFSSTPPPLDDSCDDEFGSSEDLIFGGRNNRKTFDEDLFVPKSKSSLWNDDDEQSISNPVGDNDDVNDRRRSALSDFEKELSRNLQKRRYDDDAYGNILSPSPPPLEEEVSDVPYGDNKRSSRSDLFSDDYSDSLFASNPLSNEDIGNDKFAIPSSSNVGNVKKKLPGAVNIFGASIVKDRKDLIANTTSKLLQERLANQSDVDSNRDVIENDTQVSSKSISNIRKRNYSGDEDSSVAENVGSSDNISTEDVNNSIFKTIRQQQEKSKSSSRSSSVKMSESFQDDNMSIKSNRSGLFDDVVTNTSKKSAIKKNMDDLFSDLNYQNDDGSDDDLFGNCVKSDVAKKSVVSHPNMGAKSGGNIIDDLFGEIDNTDLFSSLNVSKRPQLESNVGLNKSSKSSDIIGNTSKKELITTKTSAVTSLFDDDNVFESGNKFSSEKPKSTAMNVNKPIESSEPNKSKMVSSLFDDNDDSDLFGNSNNDLFSSKDDKFKKVAHSNVSESPSLFGDEDNLFSGSSSKGLSNEKVDPVGNIKDFVVDRKSQTVNSSSVGVKTAKVKQISLFSDEEDVNDDSLFAKVVKTDKTVFKDQVKAESSLFKSGTDDASLFSNVIHSDNKSSLSNDSRIGTVNKVVAPKVDDCTVPSLPSVSLSDHVYDNKDSQVSEPKGFSDLGQSDKEFDVDKGLPTIPSTSVVNKNPEVSIKPKPPKSLNIKAPITLPDPTNSKVSSIKQKLDVPDGSMFSSEKNSASSSKSSASPNKIPGKLNLEKTLNINPKALLPGARPISFKKPLSPVTKDPELPEVNALIPPGVDKSEGIVEIENVPSESSLFDSQPVLHSIAKDRVKIQAKRRPQTRKARQEAVRKSMIDVTDQDEVDNLTTQQLTQKSASDSLISQQANILSPSTDEEDLFGVPPLDISTDYEKVTTSPGDIYYPPKPTVISPDFNISSDVNIKQDVTGSNKEPPKVQNTSKNKTDILNEKLSESSDLFVDNEAIKSGSVDLFDDINSVVNKDADLFADMKVQTLGKDDDIFASSSKESRTLFEKPMDKLESLFSHEDGVNNIFGDNLKTSKVGDKVAENSSILKEAQHDDLFTSKDVSNDEEDAIFKHVKIPVDKNSKIKEVADKNDLFSEMEDSALFSGAVSSSKGNDELAKPVPSNICNVFNSGIVNICDKLSSNMPNDDDLFPASDWSVSGATSKENRTTITSVPEKIKSVTLFDDNNLDDDQLFSTASSDSIFKNESDVKSSGVHGSGDTAKKTIESNKLFDEDEASLFGEVKATEKKPEGLSRKTQSFVSEQKSGKAAKSLFDDDDDTGDIFATASGSKLSLKNKSSKNSSEDIFSSSSNSTKKSHSGSSKTSSVTTATKVTSSVTTSAKVTSSDENKSSKDSFVDPLSAFADD